MLRKGVSMTPLTPEQLRNQAVRCREAAKLITSEEVARALTQPAERLDAQASDYERNSR